MVREQNSLSIYLGTIGIGACTRMIGLFSYVRFLLYNRRRVGWNPRRRAARGRIGIVIGRVPQHLRRHETRTKTRTAHIFVALGRNAVGFPDGTADPNQNNDRQEEIGQMQDNIKTVQNHGEKAVGVVKTTDKRATEMEDAVGQYYSKE
jgi:hypothetical protein